MRLVRQDRARRSRCDRLLSALAQAAENWIVTAAGISVVSVDEKGATLITGEPWRPAEFVLRVEQSGGVDGRRNRRGPLFLHRYLCVSERPGKLRCSSSAMQSNAKIGPSAKSTGGYSGPASTPYVQRTWRTSGSNERQRTLITWDFLTRYYDRTHGAITG